MHPNTLTLARRLLVAAGLVLVASAGHAQAPAPASFPSKAFDITVPYPPGGGVDLLARLIGSALSTSAGYPVVVENRSGAGGTIGARYVAGRPKDGHSLLMMNDAYAIAPAVYEKLAYDPKKDLEAVINVAYAPMLLVTNASSKYTSLADVVAAGRADNAKLSYGSCGTGTDPHLAGELMNIAFKIQATHIPYKGCGPALLDVLGGQVEMAFVTISGAVPYVQSGKMKALAITSKDRSKVLPNVPTMDESGAPGYQLSQWQGLAVPGGTPENVKTKLYEMVSKIMKTDEMQKKLFDFGYSAADENPAAFQKIVNSDIDRFSKLAKQINLKLD